MRLHAGKGEQARTIMSISAVVSVSLVVLASAFGPLPDELSGLEAVSQDQGALIDAARRLDLQQKSLIEWDRQLIDEHRKAGRRDLASTKEVGIGRRIDLIRQTWEYVTNLYPNNARAVNYFGEYYYDLGREENKGLQHWRVAMQLDNKLAPPHNNLGIHYFHTGDIVMGLEHLQKALELDEENPDYLYNLSQMYLNYFPDIGKQLGMSKEKLYKEAMEMSKDAAEFAPDEYDFLMDYAVNFYAAENFDIEPDWEEAARAWQRARPHAPTEIELFYTFLNEGRVWLRSDKAENAVKPLEEAVALQPKSDVAAQLLRKARQHSV